MDTHQEITSRHWAETIATFRASPSELKVWWALPFMNAWINERLTGRADYDSLRWFKDHYISGPLDRGLVIGCGDGDIERQLYTLNVCRYFDGFDISEQLISEAVRKADALSKGHFRYMRADLNVYSFPEKNYYRLAVIHDALHHIEKLEFLLGNLQRSLTPGGLLWVNDYVGPNRSQLTPESARLAKEIYDSLPLKYKSPTPSKQSRRMDWLYSRLRKHHPKEFAITGADEVARSDPSEAIRSEDLIPLLRNRFEVLHTIFWGNTIFPAIYALIAENINISKEEDMGILRKIWEKDGELVNSKAIPSHHVFMVLRNK